jgi:hypothetical protein
MTTIKLFTFIFITLLSVFVYGQSPQYKIRTFSSKTKQYLIKVELQFSDTTLIGFTLTGNCKKKCDFSFNGQARQIGKTQNVVIPNGNKFISTEYAYKNEVHTFVFEISNDTNVPIKIRGIQINENCEECIKNIIMGQLIVPLEEKNSHRKNSLKN